LRPANKKKNGIAPFFEELLMTRAIATGLSGYGLEVPDVKEAEDFNVAFGFDAPYENDTLF